MMKKPKRDNNWFHSHVSELVGAVFTLFVLNPAVLCISLVILFLNVASTYSFFGGVVCVVCILGFCFVALVFMDWHHYDKRQFLNKTDTTESKEEPESKEDLL